ncbi:head completion/stabilization protein [Chitinimonas koreensis]|uniref:head completion/stabilization protein n=1 Tax=Chitinimonas koreensis TaxID=356302 RepID=UPI0003F56A50|nr:head completion/stabilization protein [Chitinimonas koreensis]QNM96382.1 head completion/stabilization protein [Chitinimonas koreensis]
MQTAFIATPTTPTAAPDPITNTPFFPPIDLTHAREVLRLDGTVTRIRLRSALVEAMTHANGELAAWADGHKSQGRATLAAVQADTIDGETVHVQRYRRGVYAWAHAELLDRQANVDTTPAGQRQADATGPTADSLRADARRAWREILGRSGWTVELL